MKTKDHDLVAEALPSYEIGDELGRGGWGVVLAGHHRQLGRPVAIKQLPQAFSADEDVRARFLAEARVLASLTHPHIIPIYDYVEHEGLCLLVMEQLTGGTLWSRFTQAGVTLQSACAAVMATCAALHHAHEHDVLHRDVKPENVMFSDDGVLKVTDFGIAKVLSGSEALATRAGDILGTPAYMAPEQAVGGDIGPPADVYAAGVMLYELLSGRLPFSEEGGALAIVYRHVNEEPVPITQQAPSVPAPLADVVMGALARSPDERFATAEELGVALGEAATAAWGVGWLERAELSVAAPGPILASTMRATDSPQAPPRQPPQAPDTIVGAAPDELPTEAADTGTSDRGADQAPAEPPAAPSTEPPNGAAPDTQTGGDAPRVRPEAAGHVAGAAAEGLDADELVPVREALQRPSFPVVQLVSALALVLVTLGVAFAGPAAEQRDGDLSPGTLEIAGVDPATGRVPEVDLAEPVPVTVTGTDADALEMRLSVAGVPFGAERRETLERDGDRASTLVRLQGNRYLAASVVTAELRLLRGGDETAAYEFGVRNVQQPFLTLPGALVVALVLFAVAYAESFLRHLRRGRRRVSGVIGMLAVGAAGGMAALGLAWLVGGRQPVQLTAVAVAVLGAAAGLAAALAALQAGKRRRSQRTRRAA